MEAAGAGAGEAAGAELSEESEGEGEEEEEEEGGWQERDNPAPTSGTLMAGAGDCGLLSTRLIGTILSLGNVWCCAWALLLAVSRLGFQGVITVPDSCGSLRCGTRTCTGSTPKAEGLFSNMRTRSATEPPGLEWPAPIMRRPSSWPVSWPELARAELRSEMCCFCSAVSSGCGALGISIRRLFRRRNCSNRKEEGSSPQGLSKRLLPMFPKLLGLTPPSLAGRDSAILCLASSNFRLISRNLASLTDPNSLKRFGMGACWSPGPAAAARGCPAAAFCSTLGDLRPPAPAPASLPELGALAMGMCLTGMGMAPAESVLVTASRSVWMWRGEVLEAGPLLKLRLEAASPSQSS